MYLCCFWLIISDVFQPTNRYRYQFVEQLITDILSTKEIIKLATLGIPKGMKKCNFVFLLLLALTVSSKMKVYLLRNIKQKPFKLVLNLQQGFETNRIFWNTAIRCDNNNDSLIFNHAHVSHISTMSVSSQISSLIMWLKSIDLKSSNHTTFDENFFWKLSYRLTIFQRLSWVMAISYDQYWREQVGWNK